MRIFLYAKSSVRCRMKNKLCEYYNVKMILLGYTKAHEESITPDASVTCREY
ncbi:hypothetical protein BN3590_04015 [Clostridium sp. C105KSO15]|nr:hypothetical protein BN3590_04015 [Clostridium sp. C105KSO15]